MMDKLAVARALREVGMLLEVKGENPFKVRAYETGARAVEGIAEDLGVLVAQDRLTEIHGIGKALAQKIAELRSTGASIFSTGSGRSCRPGSRVSCRYRTWGRRRSPPCTPPSGSIASRSSRPPARRAASAR